jgi:hypothetical protein
MRDKALLTIRKGIVLTKVKIGRWKEVVMRKTKILPRHPKMTEKTCRKIS